MNTNEKIAKWLGFEKMVENWFKPAEDNTIMVYPKDFVFDFLHDRNQQRWIIDELKSRGFRIELHITPESTHILIYRIGEQDHSSIESYSALELNEGIALINCVEQLIDKENEKNIS